MEGVSGTIALHEWGENCLSSLHWRIDGGGLTRRRRNVRRFVQSGKITLQKGANGTGFVTEITKLPPPTKTSFHPFSS